MNHPKRQHFIAVMLLNGFTDGKGQLHCCRWEEAKPRFWKARPRNAFVEGHLYTKRDSSGIPDMSVEVHLAEVESAASPVIEKIVNHSLQGRCPCLAAKEREALILFFIHHHRRTPENRPLVEESLDGRLAEIPAVFERDVGRPSTEEERAQVRSPEFRKRVMQNAFPNFAGVPPQPEALRIYERCQIQFAVIRNARKSFVIGSLIGPAYWFPLHKHLAIKFVKSNGPDRLFAFDDVAEIPRINERTVNGSMPFAGASEQLVRSLARPR